MRQYCLNKDQMSRFIDIEIYDARLYKEEDELSIILSNWNGWDVELVCFATLFSHILERRQKQTKDAFSLLERIYNLTEERGLGLVIEEIGEQFVEYMLKHIRRGEISLEEDLIDIRHQFSEHDYRMIK